MSVCINPSEPLFLQLPDTGLLEISEAGYLYAIESTEISIEFLTNLFEGNYLGFHPFKDKFTFLGRVYSDIDINTYKPSLNKVILTKLNKHMFGKVIIVKQSVYLENSKLLPLKRKEMIEIITHLNTYGM